MPAKPATYKIYVRNSSLQYIGEVDQFDKLTYTKRYNQVGSFVLQLDASHPMAPYLATPNNGIVVLRNGVVDFSGPVRFFNRKGGSTKKLIVKGYDDLIWVADRQAYPVYTYPYVPYAETQRNLLRLYSFGESSGTVATDISGTAHNGTYHAPFALGAATIIDDLYTSVQLSNGYITTPTTGLPTGNANFYMLVWFVLDSYPALTAILSFLGTPLTTQSAYIGIKSTGIPTMQLLGTNYDGTSPVRLGEPHYLLIVYDGTTATLILDDISSSVATATPAALTITYGGASFGADSAGNNPFNTGRIQFGMMGGALTPPSPYAINFDALPELGFSRFNNGRAFTNGNNWDTQTGKAETVMKHFVNFNLGPGATANDRQLANFTIEADSARGSNVSADALFQQLLQPDGNGLLQMLGNTGGLGFRVVQVGSNLQFQCYVPADKTSNAKFSDGLGNLGDYTYSVDGQLVTNYVVAAAGNSTPASRYIAQKDAASIASYGRIEGLIATGSSSSYTKMAILAQNAITNTAQQTSFSATLIETDGLQYNRDFGLGDKVSVYVDGTTLTDLVREVQVDLDPSTGEVITPAVGTPGAGQIIAALRGFEKKLGKLNTRLSILERAP